MSTDGLLRAPRLARQGTPLMTRICPIETHKLVILIILSTDQEAEGPVADIHAVELNNEKLQKP